MNALVGPRRLALCAITTASLSFGACLPGELTAQELVVHGSLRCPQQGDIHLTRPVKYLVVVPFDPKGFADRAEYTGEFGYYQLNLHLNEIGTTSLTLKYVGKSSYSDSQENFFGKEEYDRRKGLEFNWTARQSCDSIEIDSLELARHMRDSIRAQKIRVLPTGTISSGLAATTEVITDLLLKAPELGPDDNTPKTILVDSVQATVQQIRVGRFLSYSHSVLSQNLGFSVTPFRSSDEAVFSNPSALEALGPPSASIQIATGKRSLRGSTIIPLTNRVGLGAGVYWLRQREDRSVILNGIPTEDESFPPVDEIQATVAGFASVSSGMSVGVSAEYIYQSFAVPIGIQLVDTTLSFIKKTLRRRGVDLGLSLSTHPVRHLVLGMAVGQVFGTRVRFSETAQRSLRTLDVGVAYLNGRLNIGVDQRIAQAEGSGFGMGVNYVPFNHTVIVLGASTAYRTRTIGLRFRNFSYTFELSDAFKKLVEIGGIPNVVIDRTTHVVAGRFDL